MRLQLKAQVIPIVSMFMTTNVRSLQTRIFNVTKRCGRSLLPHNLSSDHLWTQSTLRWHIHSEFAKLVEQADIDKLADDF